MTNTPLTKTIRVRNEQLTPTQYSPFIVSQNQDLEKMSTISLISVKMKDLYENTGSLQINNTTQDQSHKYTLSYPPLNQADLLYQLNSQNVALGSFTKFDDYRIKFSFKNGLDDVDHYQMIATGNMQCLLGLYQTIPEIHSDQEYIFSEDNSLRVQYIQIKSDQVDGNFQTGPHFDNSVLCVLDRSQKFIYINKNIDVHMDLQNNTIKFNIVDQDNRPVIISWCLIEFILFNDSYFLPSLLTNIVDSDRRQRRHIKKQQYIRLTPQNLQFKFYKQFSYISLSDLSGFVDSIEGIDFINFFNIYVNETLLTCAIVDANLILQKVNNDIFTWETLSPTNTLKFVIKKGYNENDQNATTSFPSMNLRLLIK